MGNFDRTRKPYKHHIPERLRRLDHELMVTKVKDYDYLYAVGRGVRIRICVMRDDQNRCYATAKLGDRVHRCGGAAASGAVWQLNIVLRVALARMTEPERAEIIKQLQPAAIAA